MPAPSEPEGVRDTSERQWVVVNSYDTTAGEISARRACMHCSEPACAAACLTRAMTKTQAGPVVWNGDKCMGCRYCMISCPFDIPKFEYDSANPKIQKCRMCWEEVALGGGVPACVDSCPEEALTFGTRAAMLAEARKRIHDNPERYVDHIYGEHEAGGTSVLYLSEVPFAEIGLPADIGTTPYPDYTKEFLYAVPVVFTAVPVLLLGLWRATAPREQDPDNEDARRGGDDTEGGPS